MHCRWWVRRGGRNQSLLRLFSHITRRGNDNFRLSPAVLWLMARFFFTFYGPVAASAMSAPCWFNFPLAFLSLSLSLSLSPSASFSLFSASASRFRERVREGAAVVARRPAITVSLVQRQRALALATLFVLATPGLTSYTYPVCLLHKSSLISLSLSLLVLTHLYMPSPMAYFSFQVTVYL